MADLDRGPDSIDDWSTKDGDLRQQVSLQLRIIAELQEMNRYLRAIHGESLAVEEPLEEI